MNRRTRVPLPPEQLMSIWTSRLGADASPADVAVMSGLPVDLVRRFMSSSAWPLALDGAGPRASTGQVIARTLDLLERRLPAVMRAPEGLAASRRYALFCLYGLLLPGGPIDRLTELPQPLSARWREHRSYGIPLDERARAGMDAHQARWRPRQIRYRERARALQQQYAGLRPTPDWRLVLADIPDADPSLPSLPPVWDAGSAKEGVLARFGHEGQVLAASKSRLPWSIRCGFNAQVRFADTDEIIWAGDLWLLPPPGERGHLDPRRAALDVAAATGRRVTLANEHDREPFWTATSAGELRPSPRGVRHYAALVRILDEAGWPHYGVWPAYPLEHRVLQAKTVARTSSARSDVPSGATSTR